MLASQLQRRCQHHHHHKQHHHPPNNLKQWSAPPAAACRHNHALRCRTLAAATAPAGAKQQPPAAPAELVKLPPEVLAAGGLDPSKERPENLAAFQRMLQTAFLPVDLAAAPPGLRVLNIDPPVLTCDDFLPGDACDALLAAARDSGRMGGSRVGGTGQLTDDIRTSSTLAISAEVLEGVPALRGPLQQLLDATLALLGPQQLHDACLDASHVIGMQFVRPSSATQLCPELPQVAHYLPGQHFLAHEDGFPGPIALEKGYNRRATLLVYLNDVQAGGATCFEHLGLRVQPARGKALLFFPAFSGGKSDARTLHTAEDAINGHEKWVFQLWLCSGLPRRPPINAAAAAAAQLAKERKGGTTRKAGSKKQAGKKKR